MKRRIYLDEAAAAMIEPRARQAFLKALPLVGNPSAMHKEGREGKRVLEEARVTIARLAGVKPSGVVFTSGATEANTLAIRGVVSEALKTKEKVHILYHEGAHSSVVRTLEALSSERVTVEPLVTKEGSVDIAHLPLRLETVLICLEAVSPETGMRFDTRGVRQALDKGGREDILLHVDGSQLPYTEPIEYTRLGADLLTLDAQKVGGVRGIGALVRRSGVRLSPASFGGGQEWGLRPGTESPALAASFAKALSVCHTTHKTFSKKSDQMRTKLIEILRTNIPDMHVLGGARTAPNILSISLPGRDTDYVVTLLDKEGYAVSTKSACETDSSSGGRMTLNETGDETLAASTIRLSWGRRTTSRDLLGFSRVLIRFVRFLDQKRP